MKLRVKLILYILAPSILIFVVALSIINNNSRQVAFKNAIQLADAYAMHYAKSTEVTLNEYFITVRTLGQTFEVYDNFLEENRRYIFRDIMQNLLERNETFVAIWSTWEPYSIDRLDSLYEYQIGSSALGNFAVMYYRSGNQIEIDRTVAETPEELFGGSYYTTPKRTKRETILEPYYYNYPGSSEEILETTIVVPILKNEQFQGVVGIDVPLQHFQKMVKEIHPFQNGRTFLVSNQGKFVAHTNDYFVNKSVGQLFPYDNKQHNIEQKIKSGKAFSFVRSDSIGSNYYVSFSPVTIGETLTPWALGIEVPIATVMADANHNYRLSNVVGAIGFVLLTIIVLFFSRQITKPLHQMTESFKDLAKGDIDNATHTQIYTRDEIGETNKAVNQLIEGLKRTADFADAIGQGNLDADFELLSSRDVLGSSLLAMRRSLREVEKENRDRKERDRRLNWSTSGVAEFSEILQHHNDNLEEFAYHVIHYLVHYLKANQGGFFVVNDIDKDHVAIEIKAAYAYERRKYLKAAFEIGEGLVGRCVQENHTVFMTDIPPHYSRISSGLGEEAPRSLLIIPLKTADETLGAIELASFSIFENYQIEFLEKIAESIAATLSTMKISMRTSRLLGESNKKSEELARKEKEMRDNMEKMRQAQDELNQQIEKSRKNENEFAKKIAYLQQSLSFYTRLFDTFPYPVYHKNITGNYISCNNAFASMMNLHREQIVGRTVFDLFPLKQATVLHKADQHVIQKQGKQSDTHELRLPGGTTKELTFYKSVFYNSDRTIGGMYGIILKNT